MKMFPVAILAAVSAIAPVLSTAQAAQNAQPHQLQQRERYHVHAGDTLVLAYRFTPDFNQTAMVEPDGFVTLNLVGSVHIAGLTIDQAHDLIVSKASDRLNAPELTITLKDFVAPYVIVAGEVTKPQRLELREGTTAMQAVLQAGGFGENAKAGQVVVIRRVNDVEGEVHILNLAHIRETKDLERDMALQSGDMIMVPRDKIFAMSRFIKLANVGFYFNPLDTLVR